MWHDENHIVDYYYYYSMSMSVKVSVIASLSLSLPIFFFADELWFLTRAVILEFAYKTLAWALLYAQARSSKLCMLVFSFLKSPVSLWPYIKMTTRGGKLALSFPVSSLSISFPLGSILLSELESFQVACWISENDHYNLFTNPVQM